MILSDYLEQASSYAKDVDDLIWLIAAIVGPWFLLALGTLFGLIFKFSRQEGVRGQYIAGEDPKQMRWVSYPHYTVLLFDILLIVGAIRVWTTVKTDMPQTEETIRVTAQQWAWVFHHAGADNKLDTPDDIRLLDELHVLKDRTYRFELTSRDVLHSFSVPAFRLKQDVIPGRVVSGWFKPTMTGGYDIQCTEICGIGHGLMPARVIIEDAATHADWIKKNTPQGALAQIPAAPAVPQGTGEVK